MIEEPGASVRDAAPRWFEQGAPSLGDKLPLLGEALGRAAAAWTDEFATLTATPASFVFAGLTESRVAALAQRRGSHPVFAVLDAPGWVTPVLLQFDRAFVAGALEALFGGEGEEGEASAGPLSPIEARIAEVLAAQAAAALDRGFVEILPSPFRFARVLAKPDPSMLGRPNAGVIVATLQFKAHGRVTDLDVLVPRVALDAFADRLMASPDDAPAQPDPDWASRLEGGVSQAPMVLSAVVPLEPMTLGAIAALRVGQILPLPADAAADVRLMCSGKALFRCDLGQAAGYLTVRVDGPVADRRDASASP